MAQVVHHGQNGRGARFGYVVREIAKLFQPVFHDDGVFFSRGLHVADKQLVLANEVFKRYYAPTELAVFARLAAPFAGVALE